MVELNINKQKLTDFLHSENMKLTYFVYSYLWKN